MSAIVHPLNRLVTFDAPWSWTNACQEAFKRLKELLLDSPLLAHYDLDQPVQLAVDISSYGLGAVLSRLGRRRRKTNRIHILQSLSK